MQFYFSSEFETLEVMELSMLYDLVEWVIGFATGVGSNWRSHSLNVMFCVIAFISVSFYLLIMVFALEKHFKQFGGLNPFGSSALFD